jgi:hypothetical protein
MTHRKLPLYEEILLLALDDDKGTTEMGSMFQNAMGGAILAELVLEGAIKIDQDKKKKVHVQPAARVDDAILAECLDMVREKDKPQAASTWVPKFANMKGLKNRVARQLVGKGVLAEEEGTVLKIFKRTLFPERDGGPERDLRDRMERAIFTYSSELESRTVIIVALAKATGMLDKVFEKKRLKEQKQRIEDLASGQIAGQATREAIEAAQAVQAAVMVCTMVPVITASAT